MDATISTLGLAVAVFISTNIDDIFVLLGFFSDPRSNVRSTVIGQFLGIAALYALSLAASMIAWIIPANYIGLLGLLPLGIGVHRLLALRHETDEAQNEPPQETSLGQILTVASVTVANGGDNIGVYTPLFATRSASDIALFGAVFTFMTLLWCLTAGLLLKHPTWGAPIRHYAPKVVPFALIALGIGIVYQSGALQLLRR